MSIGSPSPKPTPGALRVVCLECGRPSVVPPSENGLVTQCSCGAPLCTGIAASWCPVHGDCTCLHNEDGEIEWHYEPGLINWNGLICWSETAEHVSHFDQACPLHSLTSAHADDA